ncbi:MAG: hypothetical protein OCD00_14820 [Colwellia sp.]
MLTQVKNAKTSTEKLETPFAKKWQQIEKKQKRNATAKAKINKLYQTFQEDILPEEQKLVELLAQETRHLMTFLSRKSFTQWQREELQAWIESNLDALSNHPFGNHELFSDVSNEYGEHLVAEAKNLNADTEFCADDIAKMRAMADDMFNGEKDFTDKELEAFMRDPSIFQQTFREFLEAKENGEDAEFTNEEFYEEEDDDEPFFQNGYQQHQAEQQINKHNKLKSLFNSSKLNKLYKILANKLHPDKEKNVHLKAEKSELMATLVKAKKTKDAFTLISMFHQFVPESELTLFDGSDEELSQALITLLNEKLHELDDEHQHNKCRDGIQSMVWQKLGGRSKKAQQENIYAHLADLEDSHTRLNYYIHEVKTVKLLKEILGERYEQRNFNPFEHGEFSLEDLDVIFH